MKIILLLLPLMAFAGISDYIDFGDYYMQDRKAHFINPARISETQNQVYVESKGEAVYKEDKLLVGVNQEDIFAGYLLTDEVGVEASISPFNGEGIGNYSARFGINTAKNYNFYLGFSDGPDKEFMPIVGLGIEAYGGALFAEYEGKFSKPKDYTYLIGWGKIIDNFFGDLTYRYNHIPKARELQVTVGAKADIFKRLVGSLAVQKELYFTQELNAIAQLEYFADKYSLYAVYKFFPLSYESPKYADFGINVGAAYYF